MGFHIIHLKDDFMFKNFSCVQLIFLILGYYKNVALFCLWAGFSSDMLQFAKELTWVWHFDYPVLQNNVVAFSDQCELCP